MTMDLHPEQEQAAHKPRVLLIAEACNPEWVSVPLEGWSHSAALRDQVDAHLLTHPRNREALTKRGLVESEDFTVIDNEHVARPMYRIASLLRGGKGKGWTTVTALGWPAYWEFERLVWKHFGKQLKEGRYDLVHRLTPLTPTMPSRLATKCKKIGVPFVMGPLNGGVPWPKGYDNRRRAEKEWLSYIRNAYRLLPGYRSTVRDTSAFIVGSNDTLKLMDRRALDRCVYIPENGIEPGRFTKPRARTAKLPLRCVFLGRLVPYKGADMLIRAAAEFLKRGELNLRIVGEGPQRPELEALIAELGVGDAVELAGWVEHSKVQDVLCDSDFMALPSIREFGGGVVLEAMALGLPGVVVGYGGPGELVTDRTGIRIPIGTPADLIEGFRKAIGGLIAEPGRIDEMGRASRERVQRQFTWPNKARMTVGVYNWVLGRGPRPDFGMPLPDLAPLADAQPAVVGHQRAG